MADPSYNLGEVFVSYSHRDKQWLDRLRVHLKPLERESVLDVWNDTRIAAGQTWRAEIQKAIEAANVAVLLVSKDFLASDFIAENELPPLLDAAKSRGIAVLVVILGPCRFQQTESLSELQTVNSPDRTLSEMTEAEQDRIFVNLSDQIHAALIRPVTELRDKVQEKFRKIDREFEKQYREINSDPTVAKLDAMFLGGMREITQLDRKRQVVMDELVELTEKHANGIVERDRKGLKFSGSDQARYDRQREFLEEERQRLDRQRDQKQGAIKAKREEERKALRDIFKRQK